jgi:hypothetical protein
MSAKSKFADWRCGVSYLNESGTKARLGHQSVRGRKVHAAI